jgi:L(+)-tartrate dehydratase beta subunit
MAHYDLTMPVSEAQVRQLRINDTVTLQQTLFGIRDATQIHMFDRARRTRFDLQGHAVIHTAPNVKRVPISEKHPVGYAPICVGTTTSDRMERFTRPLMTDYGVRLIVGKGGLREGSAAWAPRHAPDDLSGGAHHARGAAAATPPPKS